MGYDFSFMRLAPRPRELPFSPPADGEWSVEALRAPAAVEKFLRENSRFRPNGAVGERRYYLWETPDGGTLTVSVSKDSISVDVHAGWKYVSELFALILPFEADLLIADNQTGVFYDAAAFDAFIASRHSSNSARSLPRE